MEDNIGGNGLTVCIGCEEEKMESEFLYFFPGEQYDFNSPKSVCVHCALNLAFAKLTPEELNVHVEKVKEENAERAFFQNRDITQPEIT